MVLRVVTRCFIVLNDLAGCYLVLHVLTRCYNGFTLFHGVTLCYMVLRNMLGYRVLHGGTGFYTVLHAVPWCYRVLHGVS